MRPGRLLALAAVAGAAGCVERATAPAVCPDYCPNGSLTVVDTLLRGNISRDSAYRGYVTAHQAGVMLAAALPGIDSRAIFALAPLGVRVALGTDTTTSPVVGVDSLRLFLAITRRDTAAHNLTLALYRLPHGIDSTTTFADLAGAFTDSLAKTVNIDSLLARSNGKDTVTGDSAAVDTTKTVTVVMKLDSSQAPYTSADSAKLAFGIRVGADSLASIALAGAPTISWFVKVDSIHGTDTTLIHKAMPARGAVFRSFVFDPPPAPFGSMLAVGGIPSARSILRLSLPRAILDSSQIIRGTLILVPAVPARGAPADSFKIEAHTVLADVGAKSPLAFDATRTDTARIRIGASDTVSIEITNLVQFWASDTLAPTTLMLRSQAEGTHLAEIRFFSTATPAYAPAVRLTYAPRFPFGLP